MPEVEKVEVEVVVDDPNAAAESPQTLTGFFNALDLNRIYEKCEWNAEAHVQRLVDIINDAHGDPRVAMVAMEILRKQSMDALRHSGFVESFLLRAEGIDEKGRHLTADRRELRVLEEASKRTTEIMEDAEPYAQGNENSRDAEAESEGEDGSPANLEGHRPPTRSVGAGLCKAPSDDGPPES